MTSTHNLDRNFANKYPELNQNSKQMADFYGWSQHQEAVRQQTGGYNAPFNPIKANFNMINRPIPYNQNFLGLKTSHFVPEFGRFKWDLQERNNSLQQVPDSQICFTTSQVPRQFS
jgi:hypothetical protein